MHNYEIKNNYDVSLKSYLFLQHMLIPKHWHDNDMTIFDKVCYGEIPNIKGH